MKSLYNSNALKLLVICLSCLQVNVNAQLSVHEKDSCITSLRSVRFKDVASTRINISKDSIPNFIRHLKYCSTNFKYIEHYDDRSFEILAPKYLGKLSYGYGDNNFYYSFNDSNDDDSLTTSIVVYYDLDSSYKQFFLNQVKEGKQAAEIKRFGAEKMYLFKNWRNFLCGKLFMDRNTFVFYCTTDASKEQELRESILTFRWK